MPTDTRVTSASAPGVSTEVAPAEADQHDEVHPLERLARALGPGLVTGASDDDPSGIATYAQAGAAYGYATLWTALVSYPMMAAAQFICAKIGMVSGMGLTEVLRRYYPRWLLFSSVALLLVANTINAGADLGAVAAGINMLVPIPIIALIVPVTLVILALLIWGSYRIIESVFKWLTMALFAYVAASFFAHPDVAAVLRGTFVPTVRPDARFVATLVAIIGTTISPYLFFWQADQEVDEETARGSTTLAARRGATDDELEGAVWDVNIGMFFSNVVMYFIILTTAATLFRAGQTDIQSATQAAEALRPLAGDGAAALLGLGLIGSGFLAVPVLAASSAYAVAEALGWRHGLDQKPARARPFYAVLAASMLVGMAMNFVGINPIKALFWTAVINGVLAVPLLIVIMAISNNARIMGKRVNGAWTNVLGWGTTAAMIAAATGLFATWGAS